jgi:hypothetical protein
MMFVSLVETIETLLPNQWVETNQLFLENYLAILAKEAIRVRASTILGRSSMSMRLGILPR